MALKVHDGFDHYGTATDFLSRSGFLQWQFPNASTPASFAFVSGLTNYGKALQYGSHQNIGEASQVVRAVWANRDVAATIGIRTKALPGFSFSYQFVDTVGGAPQLTLIFSAGNYSIAVYRGSSSGTLLAMSPNNVWTGNEPNFIEMQYTIGSSGAIEVRNNGIVVQNLSISGNTQATANAWSDAWDLLPFTGGIGVTPTIVLDDLYYTDTTTGPGLAPLDGYVGDSTTRTLFATGNDSVAWVPAALTNWQEISEIIFDGDGSYNFSSTPGDQDTFTFEPLTGVITTVYCVTITYAPRKNDGSPHSTKSVVKIGGTSYFGSTQAVGTGYYFLTDQFVLDPDTGLNWVLSDVNGAAYGYNLVT